MPQAKRARPPLARHLGAQSFEDVSGETGRPTSQASSRSPELRGCLGETGRTTSRTAPRGSEFRG
eukprot:3633151-Pyramimonas_sp.AAC.1